MDNIPQADRIAKALEPLLVLNKNLFADKDIGYFYRIAEFFTDISSEKYSVLLFSCSCYILYKMNIEDLLKFKFYRDDFFKYIEDVMPLFRGKNDKIQIINGIFRYCCFIMISKNLDMNNIIVI
jgi:hypothetical protein